MIKKGVTRIGIVFLSLISLLPFWLIYLLSDVLFFLLYYVIGYRREVVQTNLANAFPEKTQTERNLIEKKYFKYLADLIMETVKIISISAEDLKRRVTTDNNELILDYLANGRNVISAAGHYCNWEMFGLYFGFLTDKPRIVVYKPLGNEIFNDFFIKVRARFGTTQVPMKQTMRKMVELKNQVKAMVLASDQTPVREDAQYFTNFLNQPTAVFLGIEKLAKQTNAVVIFYDVRRVKRGYYRYTSVPLTEHPKETGDYEITEAHVQYLEKMIRREPEYWLWSHRRWKFKPEDIQR